MHDSNCWNNDSGAKLPNVFCASATLFASLEVVPLADALLLAVDSTVEVSVPDTLDPPESLREDCPPHAFVILDEAQNTTYVQMKMFLTRMGKNAKFIITGDPGQIDLPRKTASGLSEALRIIKNIKGIGTLWLDDKDVVRHPLVKEIINAYTRAEKEERED